jgi:hypothetical protein
MKMKRIFPAIPVVIALLASTMACNLGGAISQLAGNGTPVPPTTAAVATTAPVATNAPAPTDTSAPVVPTATTAPVVPTATTQPTEAKVSYSAVVAALKNNGYKSQTADDAEYGSAFFWTASNEWEQVISLDKDGRIRLQVLNDTKNRSGHMEDKFKVLDSVFPSTFMSALRAANADYAKTVGSSVEGQAAKIYPPKAGDDLRFLTGKYNVVDKTIESYPVTFALWFDQWTCPSGYYCWYPTFPGQQFEGDSSIVFYTIQITVAP